MAECTFAEVFKICLANCPHNFSIPERKKPRFRSNLQQNYNAVVSCSGKAVLFTSDTSGALLWPVAPTEWIQHLHWGVHSGINLAQLGTSTVHVEFHKYDLANFQNIGWAFCRRNCLSHQQDFTPKNHLWFNTVLWHLGHLPEKWGLVLLTTGIPSLADLIILTELISISKEVLFFPWLFKLILAAGKNSVMLQILMFILKISLSFRKKKIKGTWGSLNTVGLNVKYDSGETSLVLQSLNLNLFKWVWPVNLSWQLSGSHLVYPHRCHVL